MIGVPDWTYHPLRPLAVAALGPRRAYRAALRSLATLARLPGGHAIIGAFLHDRPPAALSSRMGVLVPADPALVRDARRALPPLGGGVIQVMDGVRALASPDPALAPASPEPAGRVAILQDADGEQAARLLADPQVTVLLPASALVEAGPGWFQRVGELVVSAGPPPPPPPGLRDVALARPWRWPSWFWALLVGAGMVTGGLVAALITLGPVLLWYDRDYLGEGRSGLSSVSDRLVPFLQHDRLTLAGTMVTIGILYAGLAWGGLRQGWPWARTAFLLSGCTGFPTLFYYLSTGFLDPLHAGATLVLFPMFVLAVWLPAQPRHWVAAPTGPATERQRALIGQLLMIAVGLGLFAGGATISVVGLTGVFVSTDLDFLRAAAADVAAANPRLPGFIAHDRAGFGGALMSAAVAILLISTWGWRRGQRWVWAVLAAGASAGFATTLLIHVAIGYTSLPHLWPVLAGVVLTALSLALSRPYLCAAPGPRA